MALNTQLAILGAGHLAEALITGMLMLNTSSSVLSVVTQIMKRR